MFVSCEPEATNSPYGWKSRLQMLALWPISVRRTSKEERRQGCEGQARCLAEEGMLCSLVHVLPSNCTENHNSKLSRALPPQLLTFLFFSREMTAIFVSTQAPCSLRSHKGTAPQASRAGKLLHSVHGQTHSSCSADILRADRGGMWERSVLGDKLLG